MKIPLLPFLALSSLFVSQASSHAQQTMPPTKEHTVVRLWDGPAPNVPDNAGEEAIEPDGGRVKNVSIPTLQVYLPPDLKSPPRTAIIMGSGGGYARLSVDVYGNGGARAFWPSDMVVFSLKYRLKPPSTNVRRDALDDAERAVRIVRSRAKEWNIDPNRIGIAGASAGANLILNLMSNADDGNPSATDPIERQSSRVNFVGLLASWPESQKITDFHFDKNTPPVYMAHAEDDTTAKFTFAKQIEEALNKAGVPLKTEFVKDGNHTAFSFGRGKHDDWPERFIPWLQERGLLPKK